MKSSSVPGFFRLSVDERIEVLRGFLGLSEEETSILRNLSTLGFRELAGIGENPISNFELPLRIADGFKINGVDYFVPMVVEEASVVAGVCYGAKLCYEDGGIRAHVVKESEFSKAIGQMQLTRTKKPDQVEKRILEKKKFLLEKANQNHKFSKAYDLRTKRFGEMLIIDIYVDPGNAMGAAVASEMSETISKEILRITGCNYNACINSNLSGRHVRAEARIPVERLARKSFRGKTWPGQHVRDGTIWLSKWAERDALRTVTHNKGILNGVDAVAVATGQDWRAIEAANHAFASRNGRHKLLCKWFAENECLVGELEMLIPCGTVGGEIKNFPKAEFCLKKILRVNSADQLAEIMAAVGLAQNLAALSMLATIGLKEGHEPHRRTASNKSLPAKKK